MHGEKFLSLVERDGVVNHTDDFRARVSVLHWTMRGGSRRGWRWETRRAEAAQTHLFGFPQS